MPIQSFPPIAKPSATKLILGTMPGQASLAANEYYAFAHNAFWPIIEAIYGIARSLPYTERIAQVQSQGIAIWDVLQACERKSSLDSDIIASSIVVNDFPKFFHKHSCIQHVFFNGGAAEALFRRFVLSVHEDKLKHLVFHRLPSTSPANARMKLFAKIATWRTAFALQ